jgi:hypothetical protein
MGFESTARKRELGSELRTVRQRAKISERELGRMLDWPHSKVSRGENGLQDLTELDAAIYTTACRTSGPERDRLIELARYSGDPYWVRPYFDQLSDALRSVFVQESLSEAIYYYRPTSLPGLLQIEPYAWAIFRSADQVTEDRMKILIKARMEHQGLLRRRRPPKCEFLIHERALRTMFGGLKVMQEQLLHLVLSSSLPHCSIRVVPESTGSYCLFSGPFSLMEFESHPAVGYADTYTAGVFIEDRPAVESYFSLLERLRQDAMSKGESREWLAELANQYDRMEE